jgi:hypothetical protein
MSDANGKKGAQPPNDSELGAKPAGAGQEETLQAKALRDSRDWLRKVLFNLSRDFEIAAHEVGKK